MIHLEVGFSQYCCLYIFNLPIFSAQLAIPFLNLAFDVFIFGLTLRKTFHHAIEMNRLGQSTITQVILRDGRPLKFDISNLDLTSQS